MIKAIFFDFDGVLTLDKNDLFTTCKNISRVSGITLENGTSCYKIYSKELYLGQVSHADIWKDFCKCIGKKIAIGILRQAFLKTSLNIRMFELAKKLRARYKVGIITNNNKERFYLLTKKLNLRKLFDTVILSADVGGMKDSEIIFKKAIESLKLSAEECIFIDNTKDNLKIPKKIGFKTIFYNHEKNDFKMLIRQLMRLGVVSD